jgi:hypothetical protein
MFGNVNNCTRVRSFEECQRHFELTPEPTFPRGGHNPWESDERPLDDKTKHHYRIVRGPNEAYYDAVLYSTVMARYYAPAKGGRRVCYNNDERVLSGQFMWSVLQNGGRVPYQMTTGGKGVYIPIGHAYRYGDFGADLWLTGPRSDILDVTLSSHRPIEVPRMSDELKAWKKEVRKELAPVFELMKYSVEGAAYEPRTKRHAFDPYRWNHHSLRYAGWEPGRPLTEKATRVFVDMYEERRLRTTDEYNTPARIRAVEASVLAELAKMYQGKHHQYEPVPQFPEVLPRNFRFV